MQLSAKKIEQDDDPLCTEHIAAYVFTCSEHVADQSNATAAKLKKIRHKENRKIRSVQQKPQQGQEPGLKCEGRTNVFTAVSSSHVANVSVSLTTTKQALHSFSLHTVSNK